MKKYKLLITSVLSLILVFTLSGCVLTRTTNEVKNNVTNEIVNHVVNYDNLTIDTIEDAVITCIDEVQDAVIGVSLKQVNTGTVGNQSFTHNDTVSVGSGVIYKSIEVKNDEGQIINYKYYAFTNAHVVRGEDNKAKYIIEAFMGYDNVSLPATILGYDDALDLACICFEYTRNIKPVAIGNSDDLKKGQFVVAIGNPDGFDYYGTSTFGVVSNVARSLSFDTNNDGINDYTGHYIQTDAAVNPGNSGGGLFTLDGKLVGINSIKITSDKVDNMAFSIPSNFTKYIVDNFLEQGKQFKRPLLGLTGLSIRSLNTKIMEELGITELPNIYYGGEPYGILVNAIGQRGSLVGSGISKGDIILSFDNKLLFSMNTISDIIYDFDNYALGTIIKVQYYDESENQIKTANIKLVSE